MLIILQSLLWAVFGVILYREKIVNSNLQRFLGRLLYWVGVPLQIFYLARNSDFSQVMWLPPLMTIVALASGLALTLLTIKLLQKLISAIIAKITPQTQLDGLLLSVGLATSSSTRKLIYQGTPADNSSAGSFILASILGNTSFIGLALVPSLVDAKYWSWIVLYGIVHNIVGSYGLGVLIADHYSSSPTSNNNNWLTQIQNLLFLPALWAFAYGYFSRDLSFAPWLETIIAQGELLIVPGAFILIGIQLNTLQQWQNLRSGVFSTLLKMLMLPGLTGLLLTLFGIRGDACLVLVLMSGMPTDFATVILAEEYNLDRQVAASSILLSTLALPIVIFLWLTIF